MPTITIDGKTCEFDGKKMILQVALDNGIELPHYCYHEGLSVVASCRICLAEVESPNPRNDNKLELIPKLVPTCQTPASEGMIVHTDTPKSVANQKSVMEYLLINHPLDCPVCDQAGECYLQDYSFDYGRGQSRFLETKAKQPTKDIGPYVKLYSDRCIMCSRCVRFTREVSGTGELSVFGRGHTEQIDIFPGKPLDNELSGNVVDICPVGALLDKEFLFTQRVWFLKQAPSIDGITASGDNISIHHNEGQVFRVKPRKNMEVNTWWISDEIRYGWKFIQNPKRLTQPTRLQFNAPSESIWRNVVDETAKKFKAIAAEGEGKLAAVISPMLPSEEAYLLAKFIRGIDAKATLAVGPIPKQGEDKSFAGGYTIRAEKCPNSRGVRRAMEQVAGDDTVLTFDELTAKLNDKADATAGLLISGGFPSDWVTPDFAKARRGKFAVVLDILPNALTEKADLLLPTATWAEKAGSFENVNGLMQSFEQAIPVLEGARAEGQIALDLLAAADLGPRTIYNDQEVRNEMAGVFASDVKHPVFEEITEADMEFVAL